MRRNSVTTNPRPRGRAHIARVLTIGLAVTAALSITPIANGAARPHRAKLGSTMFAAEIGTTTTGATVFAGAIIDPKLHHGAIVYHSSGSTTLKVGFQEFFAQGSINGNGTVTLGPGTGGQQKLSGAFKITGGTGKYHGARGKFNTTGTFNSDDTVMATLKGSFTY
jgi:hypothetical protein